MRDDDVVCVIAGENRVHAVGLVVVVRAANQLKCDAEALADRGVAVVYRVGDDFSGLGLAEHIADPVGDVLSRISIRTE